MVVGRVAQEVAHADQLEAGALEVGLDHFGIDAVDFLDRRAGVAVGQATWSMMPTVAPGFIAA